MNRSKRSASHESRKPVVFGGGDLQRFYASDFPGSYTLLIRLSRPARIRIGARGFQQFEAGLYAYTGSAMGGVWGRVRRHLAHRKTLRWHIDYLLNHRAASVAGIVVAPSGKRHECEVNRLLHRMSGGNITPARFGASDCRAGCPSHLVYLGR